MQALQWTHHFAEEIGGDLRIEGGGVELLVAEQDLDHPDVDLLLEQMGRERVPPM